MSSQSKSPEHNFRVGSMARSLEEIERSGPASSFASASPSPSRSPSPSGRGVRRSRSQSSSLEDTTDDENEDQRLTRPRLSEERTPRFVNPRQLTREALEFCEAGEKVRRAKVDLQIAEARYERAREKLIPLMAKGAHKIDLNQLDATQLSRVGGAGSIELRVRNGVSKGPPARLTLVDVEKAVLNGLKESGNSNPKRQLDHWIEQYKDSLCPPKGAPQKMISVVRNYPKQRFAKLPVIEEDEDDDQGSIRAARSYSRSPRASPSKSESKISSADPCEEEQDVPISQVEPSRVQHAPSPVTPSPTHVDFNFGSNYL